MHAPIAMHAQRMRLPLLDNSCLLAPRGVGQVMWVMGSGRSGITQIHIPGKVPHPLPYPPRL